MVKSYSKNANHNMRRLVVNKDIVDYMRTHLQENKGHLAELEAFARKENIPPAHIRPSVKINKDIVHLMSYLPGKK